MQTLTEALELQERSWRERPLVRDLYLSWYRMIVESLSDARGPTVELGCGIGKFREVKPDALMTDVAPTRWTSHVVDAHDLPYGDGSVGNLVLLDVFHHLANPARFLDEATRVLARKGRVVIVDPYCSPVSTPFYKFFHHERTDLSAPAFEVDLQIESAPLESNQARTTLIFYRNRSRYSVRWPQLPMIHEQRFATFAYPLSGGFTRSPLLPPRFTSLAARVERLTAPLAPLLAFRCEVVLERV